jgi:hypothetical protein
MTNIRSYKELRVYQAAMDAAMRIFQISKRFPPEERYSLTDQIRRASRSVCSNIGESWRKRRYRVRLSVNLVTVKRKLKKHACGWSFRGVADTFQNQKPKIWIRAMTISSLNSS